MELKKFQRARTSFQLNSRIYEILNSCEKIYLKTDFTNITIQLISEKTTIRRTAIYKYFQNKEEILLEVLKKHIELLKEEFNDEELIKNKENFSNNFIKIFENHIIILKIMGVNLAEIERQVRVEKLIEFKKTFKEFHDKFIDVLKEIYPNNSIKDYENVYILLLTLMHGYYPLTNPTIKQIEAMKKTDSLINCNLDVLLKLSIPLIFSTLKN